MVIFFFTGGDQFSIVYICAEFASLSAASRLFFFKRILALGVLYLLGKL
jgi:hypothetical protein